MIFNDITDRPLQLHRLHIRPYGWDIREYVFMPKIKQHAPVSIFTSLWYWRSVICRPSHDYLSFKQPTVNVPSSLHIRNTYALFVEMLEMNHRKANTHVNGASCCEQASSLRYWGYVGNMVAFSVHDNSPTDSTHDISWRFQVKSLSIFLVQV